MIEPSRSDWLPGTNGNQRFFAPVGAPKFLGSNFLSLALVGLVGLADGDTREVELAVAEVAADGDCVAGAEDAAG